MPTNEAFPYANDPAIAGYARQQPSAEIIDLTQDEEMSPATEVAPISSTPVLTTSVVGANRNPPLTLQPITNYQSPKLRLGQGYTPPTPNYELQTRQNFPVSPTIPLKS